MFGFESLGGGYEILKPSEIPSLVEIQPLPHTFETALELPKPVSLDPSTPFGRSALGLDTFETTSPYNIVTEGESLVPRYEEPREHYRPASETTVTKPKTKHELKETPSRKGRSALNPEYDLEGLKRETAEISKPKAQGTNRTVKKSAIQKAVDKKQAQQLRKEGAEAFEKVKAASTGNITVEVTNRKSPELTKMADFYRNQANTAQRQAKKQALAEAKKASTGKFTVKVNDFKSPELAKLADYYKGQEALANVKAASTGNITVNVVNRKSAELTKMADFYRNQAKTAQNMAKKEALANVKNVFGQKTKFSPEILDKLAQNGARKPDAWSMADMKQYYQELEAASNKGNGVIAFLKKNKKTAIIAAAAIGVAALATYIMHKNSAKAQETA